MVLRFNINWINLFTVYLALEATLPFLSDFSQQLTHFTLWLSNNFLGSSKKQRQPEKPRFTSVAEFKAIEARTHVAAVEKFRHAAHYVITLISLCVNVHFPRPFFLNHILTMEWLLSTSERVKNNDASKRSSLFLLHQKSPKIKERSGKRCMEARPWPFLMETTFVTTGDLL